MPRRKLRSQGEVVARSRELAEELRAALARLPDEDPAVVDAVWRGEALGTLLWALQLVELPPYDEPFEPEEVELPEQFATFDQLIAATAMRGFEQGVLPAPIRGDFRAYGQVYRQLTPEQHAEAHSIALERHHALNWLCGEGSSWDDVPLDT